MKQETTCAEKAIPTSLIEKEKKKGTSLDHL